MDGTTLRATLHEGRERLFASLRGLGEEQFRHTPAGGAWNIATHLAHLLRTERALIAHAARSGDAPAPPTPGANDGEPALAQRLAVPQIIHGMQAARRELDAMLAGGRAGVAAIATQAAAHEAEHAAAIAALARGVPQPAPVIPLTPRA